jgi:hypothetical protein
MAKKILLSFFGFFIAIQAVGIFAYGTYLGSTQKLEILSDDAPTEILVDSTDQLWVKQWAADPQDTRWEIYKNGNLAQTIYFKDELNFPDHIAMDLQGNLFGTRRVENLGIQVMTYDGVSWKTLAEFSRDDVAFQLLAAGSRDDIWFGIYELIHYDGNEWQTFTSNNSPLPKSSINAFFVDSRKRLWIGSYDGVTMIENGNFQSLPDSALSGITVYSFAESMDGKIWAGTDRGVYSFDGSQWTLYNAKISGFEYYEVEVDPSNHIWVLTSHGDLAVLDGTTTKYVFGNNDNQIYDIEIGADGTRYILRQDDIVKLNADAPLISTISVKFLWMSRSGVFIYLSMFLVIVWIALALNSWGIGLGSVLGGIIFWGFESLYLFDIHFLSPLGYTPLGKINPGFALTLFMFVGGLIGYFFKRRGSRHADIIGSGIGCLGGGTIVACIITFFIVAAQ